MLGVGVAPSRTEAVRSKAVQRGATPNRCEDHGLIYAVYMARYTPYTIIIVILVFITLAYITLCMTNRIIGKLCRQT